jgi:hypothetical protein
MKAIRITDQFQRAFARDMVNTTPLGWVVTFKEEKRRDAQNRLFWSLLHIVARAEPMGRKHTPDEWKCIFMQACGWEVSFLPGLSGQFFPVGFRSSQLSVRQMSELTEFICAFCSEQGIILPAQEYAA